MDLCCLLIYCYFSHGARTHIEPWPIFIEDSQSHSDTAQSVGLLWMSDQTETETSA